MPIKILFLTSDNENLASSRIRVFQYLPYLKKQNVIYKVIKAKGGLPITPLLNTLRFLIYHAFIGCYVLLTCLFYEIIFIQKILVPTYYLGLLKFLRRKIVFDFDDAIYTRSTINKKSNNALMKFKNIVKQSDLIILTNKNAQKDIQQYNPNILIIPGPIDTNRYFPAAEGKKETVIIGWIGSPSTCIYLNFIYPIINKLLMQFPNVILKLIGLQAIDYALPVGRFEITPWRLETEVKELQEFDIGIMPLTDDEWSRGKGGYKLLQYMALGIPSVASPVGINEELIQDGINGFLVNDLDGWYNRLSILISQPQVRSQMGSQARKIAQELYSFEVATPKLVEALNKLTL